MREIDAKTALAWAKAGTARIIDVREPAEFTSAHIAGARSIPLGSLDRAEIAPAEGEKLVLVCASGRRSAMACERLAASGREVYSLAGGIGAWQQAGGAITEGARKVLPLERQVLAIAGFLSFLGVILSLLVHPYFIALSGFVGAGLMVAGLTGFCGMALLLARAPWNQRGGVASPTR
ncbi:MAG: rhodanese-like domain-containing protein [Beijerinckiaceae bacterium]|nr:rhodanese-like domain-containing protein [Beijerinckiaceae bacterium]